MSRPSKDIKLNQGLSNKNININCRFKHFFRFRHQPKTRFLKFEFAPTVLEIKKRLHALFQINPKEGLVKLYQDGKLLRDDQVPKLECLLIGARVPNPKCVGKGKKAVIVEEEIQNEDICVDANEKYNCKMCNKKGHYEIHCSLNNVICSDTVFVYQLL